jgi:hypothetical protein
MKNDVFWDITPCGSLRTDVSEELGASFIRVIRIGELGTTLAAFLRSVRRLLVTASVVPSSPIVIKLWVAQDFNNKKKYLILLAAP